MTRQRVPNAELYRDTARQNLLTNGGFEVWQRGNGPFTVYSTVAADRWFNYYNGNAPADTLSISRDTANTDGNQGACAVCTYVAGIGGSRFAQVLKTSDGYLLPGKTISLSMRIRTATANAVRAEIFDATNGVSSGTSSYHTGGGTYQTLTATATIAANCTAVWIAVLFTASCTAYVDNAMLVIGNVAADYAPMHPADDLHRCQRYYETLARAADGTLEFMGWVDGYGGAGGAGNINKGFPYKATKAVTPTVTVVGTWQYVVSPGTGTPLNPALANAGLEGCRLTFQVNSLSSATGANIIAINNPATTNIVVEANP